MSSYTYGIEFYRTRLPFFLGAWGLLKTGQISTLQRIVNVRSLTDQQQQLAVALARMYYNDLTHGGLNNSSSARAIEKINVFLRNYDSVLKAGRASSMKHAMDMYLAWLHYNEAYVYPHRAASFHMVRRRYFLFLNRDGGETLIGIQLPNGKPLKLGHDKWHWETTKTRSR